MGGSLCRTLHRGVNGPGSAPCRPVAQQDRSHRFTFPAPNRAAGPVFGGEALIRSPGRGPIFRWDGLQAVTGDNSTNNQPSRDPQEQQQPAPMLPRMPQNTQDLPSIVPCDEGNPEIADAPRQSNDGKKSSTRVIGDPGGSEEHAGW